MPTRTRPQAPTRLSTSPNAKQFDLKTDDIDGGPDRVTVIVDYGYEEIEVEGDRRWRFTVTEPEADRVELTNADTMPRWLHDVLLAIGVEPT